MTAQIKAFLPSFGCEVPLNLHDKRDRFRLRPAVVTIYAGPKTVEFYPGVFPRELRISNISIDLSRKKHEALSAFTCQVMVFPFSSSASNVPVPEIT